jgi:hypothetical protein
VLVGVGVAAVLAAKTRGRLARLKTDQRHSVH